MSGLNASYQLRVGLTGGIGCGKTTAARMLEARGCRLIDADHIGHELMEPGSPGYKEIVDRFGDGVLGEEGRIHRKKLGAIVFSDAVQRKALEQILHPKILAEEQRLLECHADAGSPVISIVEAALMVEAGSYRRYDRLVVVTATETLQIVRLEARGYTVDEAKQRIDSQVPVAEKAALADYVVENRGSREDLQEKIDRLMEVLREDLDLKNSGETLPSRGIQL